MFFHQRFIPGLAIYSYLIGDEKSGDAAVIDSTRDVEEFIRISEREGLHIRHILETHVHADFVSGSHELKTRLNGEPTIHVSGLGGKDWTPPYGDEILKDGDEIRMGDLRLKAVHTPGHTLEHLSWALYDDSRSKVDPWLILTGDFLFVGDVGRPDLLGAEAQQRLAHLLYGSVFEKLPAIPDFTDFYPGHGKGSLCGKALGARGSSTLGYERRYNAALAPKNEERWVADLMANMPIAPPYFRRMKHVNSHGPKIVGPELPGQLRISPKTVHERVCEDCLIVDVRSAEAFAAAHIPHAINIPFGHNLPTWAGWVLPYDRPTIIVTDDARQMPDITWHLLRVGFDELRGYVDGGMYAWETSGLPLETLTTVSVQQFHEQLAKGDRPTILDVRTEAEWNAGHIEGAIHIHGGTLQNRFNEVPRDKPVTVVCGSGYRATIAASFLQREGYQNVRNVLGGMSAWKAAGLPTVAA